MADTKRSRSSDDAGQAEVQKVFDEVQEKGYYGTVPPGPPNEAYSLQSGPDSPSHEEERLYAFVKE